MIQEKVISRGMLGYCCKDNVLDGENFFSGKYLKKVRSKKMHTKRLQILEIDVHVMPDKIFASIVENEDNVAMYN